MKSAPLSLILAMLVAFTACAERPARSDKAPPSRAPCCAKCSSRSGKTPLPRARVFANESAAIGALRTLSNAQENFLTNSGQNRYSTLAELGDDNPPYIDSALAAGRSRGYTITVIASGADTWSATAMPNRAGKTGKRGFFIDESGVIRFCADGSVPTGASKPLPY